jgi:MFS family permease
MSVVPSETGGQPKTWHCGTLRYTKAGLLVLFGWLLWGDFCYTLTQAVVPSVLPLKLKALDTPNWLLAMIMSTLPGVLNMTVCPWISFKSDRYRSKWGRRIPFILGSLPFLCISLVAMGWAGDIGNFLRAVIPPIQTVAPTTLTIFLLAVFMVIFTFFNLFVNSVFWYLFNDVVPAQLLGRFYGLFRMMGTIAGVGFNLFVFKYAESHTREIFTGAALLYFLGFGLACLRIREGEYPPPPPADKGNPLQRFAAGVRTFARESFSHRLYWFFYFMQAFAAIAWSVGMFQVFFYKNMGLTLEQIGNLTAIGMLAGLGAMYISAIYVDRWHPLRITAYFAVFGVTTTVFSNWIWVAAAVPAIMFFWLNAGNVVTSTFSLTLAQNAYLPVYMRVLPPSRYGQFASAASIIVSIGNVVAGMLAGAFIDWIKWLCNGSDFAYRFLWVWIWPLAIVYATFVVLAYREWKRLGGDEHYHAPAPWSPDGFEDMSDKARPVVFSNRWLFVAMRLYTAAFGLYAASIPVFLFFFNARGMTSAFRWYGYVFLPVLLLLLVLWIGLTRALRRDAESGGSARCGVPHHGPVMVMGIQALLALPLLWVQIIWTLRLGMESEVIWFGVAALVALGPNLLAIQLLRWMERAPVGRPAISQPATPTPAPL